MRTAVLSLGVALLCLLPAEAEDLGAAGLDESKVAGRWYIPAMASSSPGFLQKKDELKMAMANITVLGGGNLKISFAVPYPAGCKRSEGIYRPTGSPGQFHSAERGNKTVQVLDTDGQSYAVILASRVKDGKTLHMLRLYSRTQEVSPRVAELFKNLAEKKGLSSEMIRMLPRQEECSLEAA
ncbi:extracellular fatty acid-binding protein-like [Melanerpes formicivorus]|uniref:extracellular fatty acid-binding protein-like n=1 Tax=Melanerpes formicivorus TaxID=211600 RepID=UPI00358ED771